MTFLDYFVLIPFLTLLVVPWRMSKVKGKVKKEGLHDTREVFDSVTVRWFILFEYMQFLVDVPVFILFLPFTVILGPWRITVLYEEFPKASTIGKKRTLIMKQFG